MVASRLIIPICGCSQIVDDSSVVSGQIPRVASLTNKLYESCVSLGYLKTDA